MPPRSHRAPQIVVAALDALDDGASIAEVARRLDVPYQTVRSWRRHPPAAAARLRAGARVCPRCNSEHDLAGLEPESYAYLLGIYLGDGHISEHLRTPALRVTLDAAHPGIVDEVVDAIAAVRGAVPNVRRERRYSMFTITSYGRAWPCLFPQHGPGKKQDRPIVLQTWQHDLVARAPGRLLRGLIHTDGWRGENRVTAKGRTYSYPRYQFSSRSDDIRAIFCDGCDLLGVAWRPWGRWHISVARRDAVARLDEHVGMKY